MSIELQRNRDLPMGQTIRIGQHTLLADEAADVGGSDTGPNPHDLYDAALGACKAMTVLWYARRKGMVIDDLQVSVQRDASQERAGVYKLATHLRVSGQLSDVQLRELEAVAAKCPVHKLMTSVTTEVSTTLERLPGGA
jgi:putative redox protein